MPIRTGEYLNWKPDIQADINQLLFSERIGEGGTREVYAYRPNEKWVVKIECASTFHNCYDKVFHQAEFKNREVSFVHVYSKPVDENKLVLQEEEVSAVAWFDLDEVWEKAQAKDPDFCTPVGGLKLLREYLQKL